MDNSPYTTLEDLKDKKIGVQSGTIMRAALENMASKYGSMPAIVSFPTTYDALLALEHGEIDGVVHDILIVNSLITNSQRPYRVIPDALLSDEYVVAFRLGDTALKNAIELVFNDMAKTDFFEATSKKWFGSNISLIGH